MNTSGRSQPGAPSRGALSLGVDEFDGHLDIALQGLMHRACMGGFLQLDLLLLLQSRRHDYPGSELGDPPWWLRGHLFGDRDTHPGKIDLLPLRHDPHDSGNAGPQGGGDEIRGGKALSLPVIVHRRIGHELRRARPVPIFKTLAPRDGYLYCGKAGSGHFVKMIHNGIEYGMMAAYGEGFEILKASPYGEGLDFSQVSHLWNQGSVVRSWLLELAEDAFKKDKNLSSISGYVEDSGEGRWTVQQAIDTAVPAPVIASSLFQRFRSRKTDTFSDKVLAALRQEFGGHAVLKAGQKKPKAR